MHGGPWLKRVGISLAIVPLVLVVSATGATAAPPAPNIPSDEQVVWTDGVNAVTIPNLSGLTPAQWYAAHRQASIGAKSKNKTSSGIVSPNAGTGSGGCFTSDGYTYGPIGSQSFYLEGETCNNLVTNWFGFTVHFHNSYSNSYYLNFTNATLVNASLKWWVSGVNVSVSLPPGGTFSSTNGSDVEWTPGAVPSTWYVGLSRDANVDISATLVTRRNFLVYTDFLVSNHWYHAEGN